MDDPVLRLAAAITDLAAAIREGRASKAQPVERQVGSQDQVARRLATRLGSSLNPCRAQVRSLLESGRTLEWVAGKVEELARPGLAPWDWTKEVNGAVPLREREQAIPVARVKTVEDLAREAGMTVEEYREYHRIR